LPRIWHPEIGPLLKKYISGAEGSEEERRRVLRLVETMTIGATAVAFRTESMHGAGSPQAQRMRIEQQADYAGKMADARRIAGVTD
jgi:4-hydroxybutyryl-CoA dehydratase/vinylacetyl-CoA-Delta-isomerase